MLQEILERPVWGLDHTFRDISKNGNDLETKSLRDGLQIFILLFSEFKWINQRLLPQKSSDRGRG